MGNLTIKDILDEGITHICGRSARMFVCSDGTYTVFHSGDEFLGVSAYRGSSESEACSVFRALESYVPTLKEACHITSETE